MVRKQWFINRVPTLASTNANLIKKGQNFAKSERKIWAVATDFLRAFEHLNR
jgi:hypothetical protein